MQSQSDHRIACWQGAIGVLTDNDPTHSCTWTVDVLVDGFKGAGIEVPRVVVEPLMNPACDVFELGVAIIRYAQPEQDGGDWIQIDLDWVERMAVYLGAKGWALQYLWEVARLMEYQPYTETGDLYMWAKEFRGQDAYRCHDAGTPWTNAQVSDFVAMHRVDIWDHTTITESDILALAHLLGTMTDRHVATCRPLLERCLIKLAWMEVDDELFEDDQRSLRVYAVLKPDWWSPDAVLLGFKDAVLTACFDKTAYKVTFPSGTNLGHGRDGHVDINWRNDNDRVSLPTNIIASTHNWLGKRQHLLALRRVHSSACVIELLGDVLKSLHEYNGCPEAFWAAPKSAYEAIHSAWSEVLDDCFFKMYHSVHIAKYLPFMRSGRF